MRKNGIKSCLNALNQIMVGRLQILFIILVFVSVVRNEGRVNETEAKLEEHIYKKFEEFKAKLINEFKAMQNESKLIVRERDALKGTLIDFKNFFMKFVNDEGEIIN